MTKYRSDIVWVGFKLVGLGTLALIMPIPHLEPTTKEG